MHMQMPEELADFRRFLCLVWLQVIGKVPTAMQYEIADIIQNVIKARGIVPRPPAPDFKQRYPLLVDVYGDIADRVIVEAYRGFGKSWICAAAAAWVLGWNQGANVMATSAAKVKSDEFTIFVLQLLRDIEVLNPLVPEKAMGDRSSNQQFDVRGHPASQAASVRSIGIFGMITGGRADICFLDDIEVPKTSETQALREKLWARSAELGGAVIKPGSVAIVLGTPQCEESIYDRMERERGYKKIIFPSRYPTPAELAVLGGCLAPSVHARIKELGPICQIGGGLDGRRGLPADPDRFGEFELQKREAEYGRSGFDMQFQLNTALSDAQRFPLKVRDLIIMETPDEKLGKAPETLTWASSPELAWTDLPNVGFRGDRFYRPWQIGREWLPYSGCMMYIDPAGKGKDELAYAIVKACNGYLYLVECRGLRGGYELQNLEYLAERAKFHKVNDIRDEPNFGDGMFEELFKPVLRRIYPCHIEAGERATQQKEKRIIDVLEPVMNTHFLVVDPQVVRDDFIPHEGESGEQTLARSLFYQMTRITKEKGCLRHDDRLDALAGAVNYWMKALGIDQEQARVHREHASLQEEARKYYANGIVPGVPQDSAPCWVRNGWTEDTHNSAAYDQVTFFSERG